MDPDGQFDQTLDMENIVSSSKVPHDTLYLVSLIGDMAGNAYRLFNKPEIIGRSERADITLPERRVSGRHCQVQVIESGVQVEDLGSHNGTFVNSKRISEPMILKSGDFLRLGGTLLVLFKGADETLLALTQMLDPIVEHLRIVEIDSHKKAREREGYFQELLSASLQHNSMWEETSRKDTVIMNRDDIGALQSQIDSLRDAVEEARTDQLESDQLESDQNEFFRFQCPFCQNIIAADISDFGYDLRCGHCSEVVTVPDSRTSSGAVIADFIFQRELGHGGMGVVYLVHQISLDRQVALKVLAQQFANDPDFIVGFIEEARAAAKLNHPNVVQAYAVGEDNGIFYFAMENVEGETMKERLVREKVIPLDKAAMAIEQIAVALDYAWKVAKLIHRDIKPDNIMITKEGVAKLADLGLARVVVEDVVEVGSDTIMGTPQYISPEHLLGAPMDVRSDIYSLGATFYHLITGRFAFEGKSPIDIARKHLQAPLEPPHTIKPDVPKAISNLIVKMMERKPENRYQDAMSLVKDLQNFRRNNWKDL